MAAQIYYSIKGGNMAMTNEERKEVIAEIMFYLTELGFVSNKDTLCNHEVAKDSRLTARSK